MLSKMYLTCKDIKNLRRIFSINRIHSWFEEVSYDTTIVRFKKKIQIKTTKSIL